MLVNTVFLLTAQVLTQLSVFKINDAWPATTRITFQIPPGLTVTTTQEAGSWRPHFTRRGNHRARRLRSRAKPRLISADGKPEARLSSSRVTLLNQAATLLVTCIPLLRGGSATLLTIQQSSHYVMFLPSEIQKMKKCDRRRHTGELPTSSLVGVAIIVSWGGINGHPPLPGLKTEPTG